MADLAAIVRQHGGDLYRGGAEALIPGPGHSRRDRSLSLKLEGDRIVFYSHAGDSARDCMAYLGIDAEKQRPQSRAEQEAATRRREAERRKRERRDLAFCEEVWRASIPLVGTPAAAYLAGRHLDLSACPDLRFHPSAPRCKPRVAGDSRPEPAPHPAMLAMVRDVTGEPRGLHVTYVREDGGGKAFGDRSRLMFGPVREGAVRLAQPDGRGRVAVGEGIETTASYARLSGWPGWASLSTSGMKTLRLPATVRAVIIVADNDDGGSGVEAAKLLADRVRCDAEVHEAPLGQDWANVWEARHVSA